MVRILAITLIGLGFVAVGAYYVKSRFEALIFEDFEGWEAPKPQVDRKR